MNQNWIAKMTTNAERQAAYKERMRKAGFQQVQVWIPADKKKALLEFVANAKKNARENSP